MSMTELDRRLASLTDAELALALKTAVGDTKAAAKDEFGSEWHEQCFAAVMAFAQETNRRKH